ncbi:LPS assembly lipoprotein LptE [Halorhodospira abdelmalekii]|uniref:LPS-assembly lipoprotein LptE n=1 Tax=Halorhodospira abdelmalekii TaxID=421629 RepID=UPI001907C284|nr:LPS assembly lipoprotein LptE [Halorhodospira abdelmalekii]
MDSSRGSRGSRGRIGGDGLGRSAGGADRCAGWRCMAVALLLLPLALPWLTACGWQLRGSGAGASLDGQGVYLADEVGSASLYSEARRAIELAGGRYVSSRGEADWVLTLHDQERERETGAVGVGGDAQDYRLYYRIDYSVSAVDGERRLSRQRFESSRTFAEPAGGADARRQREDELEEELRRDALRMILLRIQAL